MNTYSDYTAPSDYVLYKTDNNVQIYILIFFWFINIIQVPQYGVCLQRGPINIGMFFLIIEAPQNGSVSEPLTHTSGHRLFKSTPGPGGGGGAGTPTQPAKGGHSAQPYHCLTTEVQETLPLSLHPSLPAPSPLTVLPLYLPLCAPSHPIETVEGPSKGEGVMINASHTHTKYTINILL